MRMIVKLLIFLAIGVGFGVLVRELPGMVVFEVGSYSIATSLWFFILSTCAVLVALFFVISLCRSVWGVPSTLISMHRRRTENRAHHLIEQVLMALWSGDQKQLTHVLKQLDKTGVVGHIPLLLLAQSGSDEAGFHALKQADARDFSPWQLALARFRYARKHQLAEDLTLARLELGALPGLSQQPVVLSDLYQDALSRGDYETAGTYLSDLQRHKWFDRAAYHRQLSLVTTGVLKSCIDAQALQSHWGSLSREMQRDEAVVCAYAERCVDLQLLPAAAGALSAFLDRTWSDHAFMLYTHLSGEGIDPAEQLAQAKRWMRKMRQTAPNLRALGELYRLNDQRDLAISFEQKADAL